MPFEGVARRCALYGLLDLDPLDPTTSWLAREGGRSIVDATDSGVPPGVEDCS